MSGPPVRLDLFVFHPEQGPAFEVWAPREMRQVPAPASVGALVASAVNGFAPNLVVGHDRVAADVTLSTLLDRLEADAAELPGAQVRAARTVSGTAGEVQIMAFIHDGRPESGPLYQMTACLLAPERDRASAGGSPEADAPEPAGAERDLIYLTGTCTVEQMATWDPAFLDAAGSVRF